MKKPLFILAAISLLSLSTFSAPPANANEDLMKLLLKTQNLSEQQATLALHAAMSVKLFGETIQADKARAQTYMLGLIQSDNMDVDYMIRSYRDWQTQVDSKVENMLNSLAALHSQLDPEQRQQLFETLQKLAQQ
ncbi:hypothetical protein HG263_13180 [Pseudoalteromonas sp. JBTF-M23]|uniref:Uncharacterized protein n=1 Tax=Pseudoalteromonas caenipelagi TaxID=2726988 RepID=A0A849VG44_9GAMM|nr:hypothetical protein [Pseudoalteromonas caenipelagi]NOU51483.1 hypothetical protein [Pseudoalteromonas caenipelagi]